ncbi:hypothetical protein CGGC5_v016501 [Colletotrichum fructicola Nara gc5]|uniref:Uncharacterized protein n=1 Tax=Colletotrichum fructicola (strain Nara gc5) TaxID=1213859 RepID=A0A7J6IFS6_COLFN|nr:hypothetical protein CGGC5_v016501 [Colletotrichum fructicola Nara gc5]
MARVLSEKRKRKCDEGDNKKAATAPSASGLRKRVRARREDEISSPFTETSSARERAQPFLLAVARMPIDVLDTAWSVGRNRPINAAHVQELLHAFRSGGLERRAPENRITVLCSAEAVSLMQQDGGGIEGREEDDGEDGNDDNDSPCELSFLHWAEVSGGKAEVMAGQHRIQALREYVKETGAPGSDLWWACELYDKDRLPRDLNVKLRVNRRDPSLPDNHGQIWTQLASIACIGGQADGQLGGEDAAVDQHVVEALRLDGEKHFPTRRLVMLWNHQRWRPVTTQWCCTRLGLDTFNISYFEWIASLRIDEYWIDALNEVLSVLADLPADEQVYITPADWDRLSTCQAAPNITSVFYTSGQQQAGREARTRVDGFLANMDDHTYHLVHDAITNSLVLTFPDLRRILHCKKTEIQIAVRVLCHVICWISPEQAAAVDDVRPKDRNKPLLREHLSIALDELASHRGWAPGAFPAIAAVQLQRRILDFVRDNLAEFRALELLPLLDDDAIGDEGQDSEDGLYGQRFKHVAWARLLKMVRQSTDREGYTLRPLWTTECATRRSERQAKASTLVQGFCANLFKLAGQQDVAARQATQQKVEELVNAYLTPSNGSAAALDCPGDEDQPTQDAPAITTKQSARQRQQSSSNNNNNDDDDDDDARDVSQPRRRNSIPSSPSPPSSPPPSHQQRRPLPSPKGPATTASQKPVPRWKLGPRARKPARAV